MVKRLSNTNVNFHSYQLIEDRTTKVVLSGLYDMPMEDLMKILDEEDIKPVTVKKLAIRNKTYDEHALYLLHFAKESVDFSKLRCISALDHCRVKWNLYSNKQGPMQCKRCQSYGQGAVNCLHPVTCIKCAGKHESKICPLSASSCSENGQLPSHKLKCANCEGNHSAIFLGCPKRPTKLIKRYPKTNSSQVFHI